ncbi:MAG TPA: hypothetical protein VM884_08835 [Flavisolibacter sp.]|jgi:hypothetical protein|nr:hypothetical protein [Flavisolibacter sp.]
MEVTAAVLFGGSLAHYDVRVESGSECYAQLSSYKGSPSQQPPQHIKLYKEGRHWVSSDVDNQLSDDLGYAVELKVKPILDDRRRGGHPAA